MVWICVPPAGCRSQSIVNWIFLLSLRIPWIYLDCLMLSVSFIYHAYIMHISFIYHSYIIHISFIYHAYIIHISFIYHSYIMLYHLYLLFSSILFASKDHGFVAPWSLGRPAVAEGLKWNMSWNANECKSNKAVWAICHCPSRQP